MGEEEGGDSEIPKLFFHGVPTTTANSLLPSQLYMYVHAKHNGDFNTYI